jgi:DNA-binding transcriptional LysR family regulator
MDLSNLKNFVKLASTLNYRKTAENIFIAQPALSRQIQQLELETGALLFKRDKRNVALTPAGKYLQQRLASIMEELDVVFKRTAQIHLGQAGEIRIGHATSAMQSILPAILIGIRNRTPDLKVALTETTNLFQMNALINRKIDIGFSPNILIPPEVSSKVIYRENFVVILPESHEVNKENFTDLSVFKNEAFILPPLLEGSGYVEIIQGLCQRYGFLPKIAYESAYSGTVLRLVEAGMGISIEPASALHGHRLNIKTIELKHVPEKSEMRMLWLTERTAEFKYFFEIVDGVL